MASEAHVSDDSAAATTKLAHNAQKNLTPVQGFFAKFNNDWSMMFAGSLAYSLLTAIVPILIAILSVLGFVLGPGTVDYVTHHLKLGNNVTLNQALELQLRLAITQLNNEAGILAFIAVVTAIFGGSRLFIGLEGCLDIVYHVRPRKPIAQNVMAILMMALFIILAPIMIFAATLPGIIQSFIMSNTFLKQIPFFDTIANNAMTIWLVGFTGGLIAAFLLFWAIFMIVPNQKISPKRSWQGAFISAFALELFITLVFPFYITHFMGNYAGQAGLAVILLVFFYYFAVIVMLGAEVNAYFFEKVKPLPNDLATFVSTMGGRLNKDIPAVEAPSHVNPKPTEKADERHIVEASKNEPVNQHKTPSDMNKTRENILPMTEQEKQIAHKKRSNKVQTLASVVFGSALAMVIELLRQKQHGH